MTLAVPRCVYGLEVQSTTARHFKAGKGTEEAIQTYTRGVREPLKVKSWINK